MRGELTPAPDQRVGMLLRSNSLKPSDRELVRHLREADAGAAETLVDTYGPQVVSARGAHHRQRGGRGRGRAEQPRSLVRMLKAGATATVIGYPNRETPGAMGAERVNGWKTRERPEDEVRTSET
jgi:hypothetical protein